MKRRAVIALLGSTALDADALKGEANVFLKITGSVGRVNNASGTSFVFTRSEYLALPQRTIVTSTPWTPVSTFVGPQISDVMRAADVHGGTLRFKSLDNGSVPVPWTDIIRYGVILAHSQNGSRLGAKRWGPLWVIYPRDRFPDQLRGPVADSRFVWQVNEIRAER